MVTSQDPATGANEVVVENVVDDRLEGGTRLLVGQHRDAKPELGNHGNLGQDRKGHGRRVLSEHQMRELFAAGRAVLRVHRLEGERRAHDLAAPARHTGGEHDGTR